MARESVTPGELDAAGAAAVLRIDVRKAPDDRQIPGSIRRDGASLESGSNLPFTPDQRIVLYCGSGNSSSRIAAALRERGYDAAVLEGGYRGWLEAGMPTEPRPASS